MIKETLRRIKRVAIAIIGTTVLLLGVAMIVLPGPAFILIPAGLAILATEFLWARWLLNKIKDRFRRSKPAPGAPPPPPPRAS